MRNILVAVLMLLAPTMSRAAGDGGVQLYELDVDLSDKAALQRGARLFVNYCLSCHGASFMRYNRMARDLGLTEDQVRENLMFTTDKVGDLMKVAMAPQDAERWFGTPPPDLSVIARSRGAEWLYTYLLTFYRDDNPARPYGVNNLVFRDVGMPNVLWELQGTQVLRNGAGSGDGDHTAGRVEDLLAIETPGIMTAAEFESAMGDLVSFLVYLGEPAKMHRYRIGTWVLAFLVVMFIVSYALKKEYWKDIH